MDHICVGYYSLETLSLISLCSPILPVTGKHESQQQSERWLLDDPNTGNIATSHTRTTSEQSPLTDWWLIESVAIGPTVAFRCFLLRWSKSRCHRISVQPSVTLSLGLRSFFLINWQIIIIMGQTPYISPINIFN